ncbi:MAG: glycosyltransferase, partial [Steroidobacter sp.]
MTDANLRQIRVLHIVSSGALAGSLQQSLFMPLLTRLPRPRVKSLVACLSPGAVPSAVLRQSGVPTYDLPISRKRFTPRAFQELQQATRNFRPDVIQAWGHTAQIISSFLRKRCDWKPQLVWSIADTMPLAKDAGLIDRQKLKYAAKFAARADRISYSSEAAASQHRRVGFPEGGHETIPPGVDATRFKPDFAARRKLREQWNLPGETFVVGMYAPFQAESDFATLIKAFGELVKINPNVALVLAGHGVQKGNAPLMGLVGGNALASRVQLLGEWSDISSLYNACDVVCSSAMNDQARMNIVMAMLCGVPCVATGMGAQGEIIGTHGVAVEPGNPAAFVKGITRVMQMTPEKRTFMAQGARKHALANYVYVRSLQRYLQLYYDLIGRQSLVTQDLPTPDIDPTLTVPPALPTEAEINASKRKPLSVADFGSDPDSLESKVNERTPEELPKWRIEQEEERTKREAEVAAKVAATKSSGDVLQVFEAANPAAAAAASPMSERARGVAEDVEELLSPEMLAADAPSAPRVSNAPSGARKSSAVSQAPAAPQSDSAKQAALKAAQRAALQPIGPGAAKRPAAVKPAAKPAVIAMPMTPSLDFNSTQPFELLPASEVMQSAPAPVRAESPPAKAPSVVTPSSSAMS